MMRLVDISPDERQELLDLFKENARSIMGLSWEEFRAMWTAATQDEKKEIYQMMKGGSPRESAPE